MAKTKPQQSASERLAQEAWIGDAVLCLYVRLKILREDQMLDGEKCIRMTSNKFLNSIGEPTAIEAEVGRVFQRDGLETAFTWIEQHLMPVFERQESNREKKTRRRDQ